MEKTFYHKFNDLDLCNWDWYTNKINNKMKKFKFAISIDGFTQYVIIEANNRADAERLAKVQYAGAKYIRFTGTVQ